MKKGLVIVGPFVHALDKLSPKCLDYCSKGAIVVGNDGVIEKVFDTTNTHFSSLLETQWQEYERITLKPSQIVIPGMVDTHAHAPQYFNSGLGLDLPLLEWLNTYTFPVESKFKDLQIAVRVYTSCVRRSLMNGTTTSVYFGTIHNDATLLLAKIVEELGQRAYVGKVSMDRFAPEYYCEETAQGVSDVRKFLNEMKTFKLVKPILTPRFAVSCSEGMMKGLAEIYKEFDIPIQSHISENTGEVKLVSELFQSIKSYAEVYDEHGLLNEKTILAHGIYLTEKEIELIKERKATIAHCPLSNFSLCSGVLNVRKLLNRGVKVSLGTDISGGYSSSMFNAIRNTLIATSSASTDHIRSGSKPSNDTTPLTIDEAFYLATVGGAQALNIQDQVGNFVEGKNFDALIIDVDVKEGGIDAFNDLYGDVFTSVSSQQNMEEKKLKENFTRFLFNGDDRNISNIFVQGRDVTPNLRDLQ